MGGLSSGAEVQSYRSSNWGKGLEKYSVREIKIQILWTQKVRKRTMRFSTGTKDLLDWLLDAVWVVTPRGFHMGEMENLVATQYFQSIC